MRPLLTRPVPISRCAIGLITAFRRAANGQLSNPRSFATEGQGTGTPEDSANGYAQRRRHRHRAEGAAVDGQRPVRNDVHPAQPAHHHRELGAAPGLGAAASYEIDERTGALTAASASVANRQSDTC